MDDQIEDYELSDNEETCDGEYDIDEVYTNTKTTENVTHFMKNYEEYKKSYKTNNYLTKYEKTRILSERSQQLEIGATPFIPNIERFNTSYEIAVEELNLKKIPYIIRRPLPDSSGYEYWKLSDMII